jgi:branched-chain amino acid transport system substrate-binding protein
MKDHSIRLNRRTALVASAAAFVMPAVVRAQGEPIRLATLTPLTAPAAYGPLMAERRRRGRGRQQGRRRVGRRVQLTSEDDQTTGPACAPPSDRCRQGVDD